jgi:hypothetical protein
MPAIGDLFDMFDFDGQDRERDRDRSEFHRQIAPSPSAAGSR